MIPTEKYIVCNKNIELKVLNNEVFIVRQDTHKIHSLNRSGSFIWQLFNGKHTLQQVIDTVCDQFEVSKEVAKADASEFVSNLLEQGLVELHDIPGAE